MADTIFGYFENPTETVPTFDPGLNIPCPLCLQSLVESACTTISLMPVGGDRSYFYRAHKICYTQARSADIMRLESSLIDTVAA